MMRPCENCGLEDYLIHGLCEECRIPLRVPANGCRSCGLRPVKGRPDIDEIRDGLCSSCASAKNRAMQERLGIPVLSRSHTSRAAIEQTTNDHVFAPFVTRQSREEAV